jgi:hypothetical protein
MKIQTKVRGGLAATAPGLGNSGGGSAPRCG